MIFKLKQYKKEIYAINSVNIQIKINAGFFEVCTVTDRANCYVDVEAKCVRNIFRASISVIRHLDVVQSAVYTLFISIQSTVSSFLCYNIIAKKQKMSARDQTDAFFECLQKTMKLTAKYGDTSMKDIGKFTEMAKMVCAAETDCQRMQVITSEFDDFENVDQFNERLCQLENTTIADPTESVRFKQFERNARLILLSDEEFSQAGSNRVESDDFIMEDVVCDIDPITKGPLENPVRNKICGHIYGKTSIVESLKMNQRLRCPSMGCRNKKHIRVNDLVDDFEYARKLQIARRNREKEDDYD